MHYGKRKFSQGKNLRYGSGRRYAYGGAVSKPDEPKVVRTIFEEEEFEYADGGKLYDQMQKKYEYWRKRYELNSMMVKSKIALLIGIDKAIDYMGRDYSIHPFRLIEMAVNKGFITVDEIDMNLWNAALSEAEQVTESYRDSGEGIGSSDINAFISNMLNDAGIKVVVKNNQYVREGKMADGGMMKRGGKLMDKANYIPNRMIQAVEVERKGKTTEIDGADIFDGIYVKKRVKYGLGGSMDDGGKVEMSKKAIFEVIDYDVWGNEEDGFEVNNKFRTGEKIMLEETMTDNEITKSLIRQGALKQEADGNVDYDGEFEYTLYLTDSRNSEPIMELQFLRFER